MSQSTSKEFSIALREAKHVWDLMVALWGRLPFAMDQPNEEDMEVTESGGVEGTCNATDSHEITMRRKEALSAWLEAVVEFKIKEDFKSAKQRSSTSIKSLVEEELALLSGNKLKETCDRSQSAGDHYSAILTAQAAGGSNSVCSQMLFRYMEHLQVGS